MDLYAIIWKVFSRWSFPVNSKGEQMIYRSQLLADKAMARFIKDKNYTNTKKDGYKEIRVITIKAPKTVTTA